MKFKELPSQKYLRSILHYDAKTGIFVWKHDQQKSQRWNTRYAGSIAGYIRSNEYWNIKINYTQYRAHRLAWVYIYGDVLDGNTEIDHKNRIKSDNSINNLRLATKSQNSANSKGKSKCGLPKGVEKNKKKFTARIMVDRVRKCLGTYDTPEEAQAAYLVALSAAHGEFARAA